MDDGQRVNRGGITLCTDSYPKEGIQILRDALKNNFNLDTTIHNKKGKDETIYERIYIKKEGFEEIKSSLLSHMHDSMLYKIKEEIMIKQNSEDIVSESEEIIDIFDIGGS